MIFPDSLFSSLDILFVSVADGCFLNAPMFRNMSFGVSFFEFELYQRFFPAYFRLKERE